MTGNALINWRCYFWHLWRWNVSNRTTDICVRAGCGEIRPHQQGTKLDERGGYGVP